MPTKRLPSRGETTGRRVDSAASARRVASHKRRVDRDGAGALHDVGGDDEVEVGQIGEHLAQRLERDDAEQLAVVADDEQIVAFGERRHLGDDVGEPRLRLRPWARRRAPATRTPVRCIHAGRVMRGSSTPLRLSGAV